MEGSEDDDAAEGTSTGVDAASHSTSSSFCDGPCNEQDFLRAAQRAEAELEREGITIDPGVWEDPRRYAKLFERMVTLTGGDRANSHLGRARAPLSSELQRFSNPYTAYCGPGYGPNPKGDTLDLSIFPLTHAGSCLSEVCFEHDRCYATIADLSEACLWSTQTARCDNAFFVGARACEGASACDYRCHIVQAIAATLQAKSVERDVTVRACPACRPKTCGQIGGECGSIADGCGGTIQCGDCAAGERCDEKALVCESRPTPATQPVPARPTPPPPSSSSGSLDACCDYRATFDMCGASGLPANMVDCAASSSTSHFGCEPFDSGGVLFCCQAAVGRRC
jgi:hypothetical protein